MISYTCCQSGFRRVKTAQEDASSPLQRRHHRWEPCSLFADPANGSRVVEEVRVLVVYKQLQLLCLSKSRW